MRSESEVRLVRAVNVINGVTKRSQWHVMIPGVGDKDLYPGTACSMLLGGKLETAMYSALENGLEGVLHERCRELAKEYLDALPRSTEARIPDEPRAELAQPDNAITRLGREFTPTVRPEGA